MRITLLQNITRIYSGGSPKLQFTIFDGWVAGYAEKPLLRNRMESQKWSAEQAMSEADIPQEKYAYYKGTVFYCDNTKLRLRLFWQ